MQFAVMNGAVILGVLQAVHTGEVRTFLFLYQQISSLCGFKCVQIAVMNGAVVLCVLQAVNNGEMRAFKCVQIAVMSGAVITLCTSSREYR